MGQRLYNAPLLYMIRKAESFGELLSLVDRGDLEAAVRDAEAFARTSVSGPLDDKIAFMRIPKCATTSVHYSIARAYRSVWAYDGSGIQLVHHGACNRAADARGESTWEMRRAALAYHLSHPDSQYVYGHFEINRQILDAYADQFNFVTLLRNPVDRWISHYLYNKHLPRDRYDIDVSMEEFLETERGRGIGQMYTAYLTGTGALTPDERETDEIRRLARENLEEFELVGIVERMDQFREEFEERFGIDIEVHRRNKSPAPEGAKDVGAELRAKIREVCALDVELFEYARDRHP